MFTRILIANRGEIACRIARSCTRLGVEFVAVYSDADAGAAHLQGAAACVRIGEAAAVASYLDGARIIVAAKETGCEAIHPGYGFLSENADFARAVEQAGLVFIGPRADTIEMLGDKGRAKQLMRDAGVPVVPGSPEATEDVNRLTALAADVGYPLLLKPSAGGGGKGMQIVRTPQDLPAAVEAGVRLARSSFGDGRLLAERYVERPRHIEVQVFGDAHGNIVHAYERECSLQRRHQKVLEEAPAATISDATRQALVASAVDGARALGYVNAGTFEFIVAENGEYFFLEVNTRLQVEHPVSESITGLDFVEWQLRIASGEPLPCAQADVPCQGHAIEVRVYAEDPMHDFRPAPGRALRIVWPDGVRVDTALADEGEITPYYDPMVAKLIVHAATRAAAFDRLLHALTHCATLGLTTNLGLLEAIAADDEVRAGRFHTRSLDERLESLIGKASSPAVAACALAVDLRATNEAAPDTGPWGSSMCLLDRSALSSDASLGVISYWDGDEVLSCSVAGINGSVLSAQVKEQCFPVTIDTYEDLLHGTVCGQSWWALDHGDSVELQVGGWRRVLHRVAPLARVDGEENQAFAPMHGMVVVLNVKEGDKVAEGDLLLVLEAMKMEHQIRAPRAGTVVQVNCEQGVSVASGQILVDIETVAV